jgi:dienelactone hydrolase
MQKQTVTYYSEGDVIVGDLYWPDALDLSRRHPAILQCQGFTGIRDMVQPEFARYFTDAGYVALAIDYRGWGDSGGERGRLAPLEQVEDCRNGYSYLESLDFVDGSLWHLWREFRRVDWSLRGRDRRADQGQCRNGRCRARLRAVTNRRTPEQMAEWQRKAAEARRKRVLTTG